MSTLIKYKNDSGIEITENQAHTIGNFNKHLIVNNSLKIAEEYKNNALDYIVYYMDTTENLTDLVSQYSSYSQKVSFIRYLYTQNGYNVYEELTYQEGNLKSKSKRVDNTDELTIAIQHIDVITDLPEYTIKFYDSEDGVIYEFKYGSNGDLNRASKWLDPDGEIPQSQLSNPDFFDWTGLDFYRKAEPIIPGS